MNSAILCDKYMTSPRINVKHRNDNIPEQSRMLNTEQNGKYSRVYARSPGTVWKIKLYKFWRQYTDILAKSVILKYINVKSVMVDKGYSK